MQVLVVGAGLGGGLVIKVAESLRGRVFHTVLHEDAEWDTPLSPGRPGMASQDHVEPVLLRRVRELGAGVVFETPLVSLAQDADAADRRAGREHRDRRRVRHRVEAGGGAAGRGRRGPAGQLRSRTAAVREAGGGRAVHSGRRRRLDVAHPGPGVAAVDVAPVRVPVLADPTGEPAERYGVGHRGASLVRPDGVIAWRTDEAAGDPVDRITGVPAAVLDR